MSCSIPSFRPSISVQSKTLACLILDRSPQSPKYASTFFPGYNMDPSFDENIDVSFIKPGLWGPFTHIIYPVCMHKHIL